MLHGDTGKNLGGLLCHPVNLGVFLAGLTKARHLLSPLIYNHRDGESMSGICGGQVPGRHIER